MVGNDFERKKDELNGIIKYFSEDNDNDGWHESEKSTALGTIALRLEEIGEETIEYNTEERKELLLLSAKAIRLIY
ncbi:hypothetical protein LFT63_12030 [Staphylococcus sp. FSL H8-0121]|uniref:hypothetical protein n=1 Tax=Staphylococcus TaxID=1279 RepID=UPI002798AB31|nr:hypothetical protein PYH62_11240 [Staphylococcus hominis]